MTENLRPRKQAIMQAWQDSRVTAPEFEGKNGQLVARAIKCVVDPLIIRPSMRPHLSKPLLGTEAAEEITWLIRKHKNTLEDAGAWFRLLKATRRARKITDGNIQELYFPRAFELASQHGAPNGVQAEQLVHDVLDDIHATDTPSTHALRTFLHQAENHHQAATRLEELWPEPTSPAPADPADLANAVWDLFNGYQELWDTVIEQTRQAGQAVIHDGSFYRSMVDAWGPSRVAVKVSQQQPLGPPPVLGPKDFLALDRHLYSRSVSALRRLRGRATDVDPAEVVATEIERATSLWGLHSPSAAAVFVAGIFLALDISPFDEPSSEEVTQLSASVHSTVRTQAYVMHLRRVLTEGDALHPAQAEVVEQLHEFWHPYLNRLWIRLHGIDVTRSDKLDAAEAEHLLEGVAYSVVQDLRDKIRQFLEAQ